MLATNDYLSRPFEFSFRYNVNVSFKILSVVFLSVMFYVPVSMMLTQVGIFYKCYVVSLLNDSD